ncbi:NAD-dependent epimerase dehydratase [Lactobacillus selangorensis]|uniref:NAD-dependent epimerase dehydratase n=1 Tax=Lactobacillus selangorensis TaxID=81857 RepID=A0A0R2G0R8_9LACO|nr:NAD(P)H-binding protein [Lactobacillus selangorensis]KRN28070.1 NAD-dependent epimerase dehydratase [Lactobacillus selangorensis]KRN31052.1 NAD-dependent epimerase dehydratase [Lactobacillus selangorensis]
MKNVLILGANGRIARIVRQCLLEHPNKVHVTSYLRNAARITPGQNETVIDGDVMDEHQLSEAMAGQDIVYANLVGNMARMASNVLNAMKINSVQRLIWVTGSGLYHEVPNPFGDWVEKTVGHASKEDTREAARLIESSSIKYTIIRAAVMTDADEIDYELTEKGTPFKGKLIPRKSIADFVVSLIKDPSQHVDGSLGIDKPGSTFEQVLARF